MHWRGKRRSGSAIGRCHVTKSLRLQKPLSQAVRAGLFPLPKLSSTILAQPERSCRNSWKCMTGNSTLWPNQSCELSRQQVLTDSQPRKLWKRPNTQPQQSNTCIPRHIITENNLFLPDPMCQIFSPTQMAKPVENKKTPTCIFCWGATD